MDIQIVDREEEILDPQMPIVDKIGVMSRICYRSEPKEGQDEHALNVRVVGNCVKSGHESVVEHGIISVVIDNHENEDSKRFAPFTKENVPVPFYRLWMSRPTDSMSKYIEQFQDIEIYSKFCEKIGKNDQKRITSVLAGDVRAWRRVIKEKLYIASQTGDVLTMLLLIKVVKELNTVDNGEVLFTDIVGTFNEMLADEKIRQGLLVGEAIFKELKEFTVDTVSDYYFKCPETVFAATAAPNASLSVIITTDRAFTHQHVRHRKNVAYSQESQRYVNYDKKGYRVIPLTVEPSKYPDDFIEDYNLGKVRSTSVPYIEWHKAMEDAFTHYQNLLHIYEDETGNNGGLQLPPETCRGVLPNDTATKLGVTWFNQASFINFVYWRLDKHAQYAIRATVARIIVKGLAMHHPFFETINYQLVIKWLEMIKEQKLLVDDEKEFLSIQTVDKLINERKQLLKVLNDELDKMKTANEPEIIT